MNPTAKLSTVTVATAIVLASGSGLMAATTVETSSNTSISTNQQIDAYKTVQARGVALVEAELQNRGYVIVERRRTLLGRNLVRAENKSHVREVVVHQRTGEILRDVIMPKESSASQTADVKANGTTKTKSNNGLGLALGLVLGNNASAQGQSARDARSDNSVDNNSGATTGADNGGGSRGGSVGASVGGSVGGGFGGGSAGSDAGADVGGGLGIGN